MSICFNNWACPKAASCAIASIAMSSAKLLGHNLRVQHKRSWHIQNITSATPSTILSKLNLRCPGSTTRIASVIIGSSIPTLKEWIKMRTPESWSLERKAVFGATAQKTHQWQSELPWTASAKGQNMCWWQSAGRHLGSQRDWLKLIESNLIARTFTAILSHPVNGIFGIEPVYLDMLCFIFPFLATSFQ